MSNQGSYEGRLDLKKSQLLSMLLMLAGQWVSPPSALCVSSCHPGAPFFLSIPSTPITFYSKPPPTLFCFFKLLIALLPCFLVPSETILSFIPLLLSHLLHSQPSHMIHTLTHFSALQSFSSFPILTLDTLHQHSRAQGPNQSRAPALRTLASLKPTAQPGWGSRSLSARGMHYSGFLA